MGLGLGNGLAFAPRPRAAGGGGGGSNGLAANLANFWALDENGLADGLANFWALDEANGDRVNTERALPLVETGGSVTTVQGVRGGSSVAALTTHSVHLDSIADASFFAGNPFTVAVFFKLVALGADTYINPFLVKKATADISAGQYFAEFDRYGGFAVVGGGVSNPTPTTVFVEDPPSEDFDFDAIIGSWHLLTLGSDGANVFVQVDDGTRYSTASAILPPVSALGRMLLGADAEVGVECAFQFLAHWDNRALSEADVALFYNDGQGRTRAEMTGRDRINSERDLPLVEIGGVVGSAAGPREGTLAAQFNGTAGSLTTVPSNTLLTANPFTYATWVYLEELVAPGLSNPIYLQEEPDNGNIYAGVNFERDGYVNAIQTYMSSPGASGTTPSEPPVGEMDWEADMIGGWHLVTFGYDGANQFLQLDTRARQSAGLAPLNLASITGILLIGEEPPYGGHLKGRVGPVAHWENRVLSDADVETYFNGGVALTRAELT